MTCKKCDRKAFNQKKQNRKRTSKCRTVSTGAMTTHFQIRGRYSVGAPGDYEFIKGIIQEKRQPGDYEFIKGIIQEKRQMCFN